MNDELLWRAIEGALGTEKTAYLRYAPLSAITGAEDLTTAVAAHSSAHHEKKAFWRTVGRGLQALDKVAAAPAEDTRPYPPNTSIHQKIAVAKKARVLESALSGVESVKVAAIRREVDNDIFDGLLKAASGTLMGAIKSPEARALAEKVIEGGKNLGSKALQGAAVGTGLAVPLYIGGTALAEDAAEEARNKALQTAAGVGGMAMLGYGANRLMDNAAYHDRHKQAAADDTYEKISALTATVYIDQFLAQVDQTEKVAALREINRDYGVSLLCDLEKSAAIRVPGEGGRWTLRTPEPEAAPITAMDFDWPEVSRFDRTPAEWLDTGADLLDYGFPGQTPLDPNHKDWIPPKGVSHLESLKKSLELGEISPGAFKRLLARATK